MWWWVSVAVCLFSFCIIVLLMLCHWWPWVIAILWRHMVSVVSLMAMGYCHPVKAHGECCVADGHGLLPSCEGTWWVLCHWWPWVIAILWRHMVSVVSLMAMGYCHPVKAHGECCVADGHGLLPSCEGTWWVLCHWWPWVIAILWRHMVSVVLLMAMGYCHPVKAHGECCVTDGHGLLPSCGGTWWVLCCWWPWVIAILWRNRDIQDELQVIYCGHGSYCDLCKDLFV